METKEQIGKNVYKTSENDPLYFGGYLNMARHNVFLIINHLTEVFDSLGYTKINDDEDIVNQDHILSQIFDPSKKELENERIRIYNYMIKRHHLPFLKVFNSEILNDEDGENMGIDFKSLHNFIIKSFKTLNDLRNSYSHYLAIDDDGNKIEKRSNIVDVSIKSDIKQLFKHAPKFSFIRNQETQHEEDYNHLDRYRIFENETNILTDQGLYFFINLFLERNHATKFLKKIKGFKNETTPPFRATIQSFTSFALKLPDIRLSNERPLFSLLMNMLTELNKCPKELFNHLTQKDKKEFEPLLNDEEKHNVVLNSTNYSEISDDELDEAIREITALKRYNDRFPYFALRFLDETNALKNIRFQITLGKLIIKRYDKEIAGIEENRRVIKTINAFGKLSDFIDNEEVVLKELKKNLADNNDIRFEQYSPHYNTNNIKIAFYVFDEGDDKTKYPFVFENKENNSDIQNNPSGFLSIHDLPKMLLFECLDINLKPENIIIDFIRSTNLEMFDLSELEKIRKQANYEPEYFSKRINKEKYLISKKGIKYLSKEVENNMLEDLGLSKDELILKDKDSFMKLTNSKKYIEYFSQIKYQYYLQKRREELQRHLPKGLKIDLLPENILEYLMDFKERNNEGIIHQKVAAIRDEAKNLKKSIESEVEKPKNEQRIKLGELATFVARDIIKMVICKEVKDKITSPYYNKLQNKIAYFSLNKDELIDICDELKLFNENEGHVFFKKELIKNSDGIIDFTLDYLRAKDNWIETKLLKKGKTGGYRFPDKTKIPLSFNKIKNKANSFDFKTWLKNKSQLPVDLPRSLFDEKLEIILKGKLNQKGIIFNTGDKFSVLLSKYLNNDTQVFYNYCRSYSINKKIEEFEISGLSGKEIKKNFDSNVEKNEKSIRFIQTKDRVLKLISDKILSIDRSIGLQSGFCLTDIHPAAKHNPLDCPAVFEQKIIRRGDEVFCNIIAKDTENQIQSVKHFESLQAEEEKEAYPDQKWYQWTIKDFGRFKRFIKDRRIPNLSNYFEDKNIPFDLLEYQLREYNKYKEEIFELTLMLEKEIINYDFEGIRTIEFSENRRPKGFYEIRFDTYMEWLDNKNIQYNKERVKECRNKFSHSEYPLFKEISKISKQQITEFETNKQIKDYKSSSGISIAEKIYNLYKLEIERIINSIKNNI